MSANTTSEDHDQPPILENEANGQISEEPPRDEYTLEEGHIDKTDPDNAYEGQDMIGRVVRGEDGELYLLAAGDEDGNPPPEGIMDMNSVEEIKIVEDTSEVIYYNEDKEDDGGDAGPSSSVNRAMTYVSTITKTILPQGMKGRRNRVYGQCKCPDCGQSFVNTARLERHLAVHQIFGNYSCPLCGKTYKYEYNLFYHWRKTCRDLDDVFSVTERKGLDVNTLRSAVDDLVRKKEHYGPMTMSVFAPGMYRHAPYEKVLSPVRRSGPCKACGVSIPSVHMQRHLNLHRGFDLVDEPDGGYFYCDLCGLTFRQHFNLIKHWRSACPEIQANLPTDGEPMDDTNLKMLVADILQSVVVINDFRDTLQHIVPRELNLREKARQYDSTTDDLNFSGNHDDGSDPNTVEHIEEEIQEIESEEYPSVPIGSGVTDSMIFTDDVIDDDGASHTGNLADHNRSKWGVNNGMPVQCHECKRPFANAGRLERHMAGYHSSTGSHHCPLCGNRFKYDYNLLYHYRRSCPYTKSFIETDMRQQLDAQTLRKLVRSLAAKDLRVTNPELAVPSRIKEDYGDVSVRREMLGKPEMLRNLPQIAPNRPGMPDGKPCPICGIVFYGMKVLERHVYTVHPDEHAYFDPEKGVMREPSEEEILHDDEIVKRKSGENESLGDSSSDESVYLDDDGNDLGPPQLEKEGHSEEHHHHDGPLQIIDEHGNILSQVRDFNEVQEFIETGHLGLRHSDRFVCLPKYN